jgi:hypothetical protein
MTYYAPGLGACGYTSTGQQNIVSISHLVFDAVPNGGNPNHCPLCGKQIRISHANQDGTTASVMATVVDRCKRYLLPFSLALKLTSCKGVGCAPTDLDVAPAVFTQLAPMGDGRVKATWEWV